MASALVPRPRLATALVRAAGIAVCLALAAQLPGAVNYIGPVLMIITMSVVPPACARVLPSRFVAVAGTALLLAMTAIAQIAALAVRTGLPGKFPLALFAATLVLIAEALRDGDTARSHVAASRDESRYVPGPATRSTASLRKVFPVFGCLRPSTLIAIPALSAGLASGLLAHFQLFALCGGTETGSFGFIAAATLAAFGLGTGIERLDPKRVLAILFVVRSVLLALLVNDAATPFVHLAAPFFALLDCLTIPTLMKLNRPAHRLASACPGGLHHVGMLAGAALATMPYFFGDGFGLLFAFGAALNLLCSGALAGRMAESPPSNVRTPAHRPEPARSRVPEHPINATR